MAKMEGPEEFFEALRAAKREKLARPAVQGPDEQPAESPDKGPAGPAESAPARRATGRSFLSSIFTEDEPTIPVRRSTLICAVVAVIVLLFIAYAVGKRAGTPSKPNSVEEPTVQPSGAIHFQEPALPAELKGHFIVYVRTFDHTRDGGAPNARAFEEFLNTSPETEFVRQYGKKVYVLSYNQKLLVCVGPFDGENDATAIAMRSRLQKVRRDRVLPFAEADIMKAPDDAQLYEERGDTQ